MCMNTYLFRVDASEEIGMGHLIRSLSLASEIKKQSFDIQNVFLTSEKYAFEIIQEAGYDVILNKQRLDEEEFLKENLFRGGLLFIDKLYDYSPGFIADIKEKISVVMFHNLCEGTYYADAFILPSAHSPDEVLNDARWNQNKVNFYHGFDYVILNEKIRTSRNLVHSASGHTKIVITTGGSDPRGVLFTLFDWLIKINANSVEFTFLVGDLFMHKQKLEALMLNLPASFKVVPYNVEEFFDASIVISTFGVTSYEMLYLGIPLISVAHAETNAKAANLLYKRTQAFIDHGLIDQADQEKFNNDLLQLIASEEQRTMLAAKSLTLLDGKGIQRVAQILMEQFFK